MRLLPIFLLMLSCLAYGQELNNPKKLPSCPNPKQHGRYHKCWGTAWYFGGESYVGEFDNGLHHGQGTYIYGNGDKYLGEFKDGKFHGHGTFTTAAGDKYAGEFKNQQYDGRGTFTSASGDEYVGEWKNNKRHGHGTDSYADGEKYVGAWKEGKRHGRGTLTLATGSSYSGEFKDGNFHGHGTLKNSNGSKYVGEFKDNLPDGLGISTLSGGGWIYGEWRNGKGNGQAIIFDSTTGARWEGIVADSKPVREAKVTLPPIKDPDAFNKDPSLVEAVRKQATASKILYDFSQMTSLQQKTYAASSAGKLVRDEGIVIDVEECGQNSKSKQWGPACIKVYLTPSSWISEHGIITLYLPKTDQEKLRDVSIGQIMKFYGCAVINLQERKKYEIECDLKGSFVVSDWWW